MPSNPLLYFSGKLMHALADKRCPNFNTCGDLSNMDEGMSHVNIVIFENFDAGLRKILAGQCSAARENKNKIEDMMTIPLVQGTIRYAYINEFDSDAGEKAEAEGAVFAAAVLPVVAACEQDDADIIYDIMKVGGSKKDFAKVKAAFERNYACMGIQCAQVGGVWDSANKKYMAGAEPCGSGASSSLSFGFMVTMSVGVLSAISMLF